MFSREQSPQYDEALGVTNASARAWTVIFSGLIAATLASSVAGTAMAVVTTGKDARGRDADSTGWKWGALLAIAGFVLAAWVTSSASSELFQTNFMNDAGDEVIVNYGALFGSLSRWSFFVAGLGGAAMTAAIVAVGIQIDRSSHETSAGASLSEIEAYRRASTSANLILAALAVSLSFGVLATAARIRLMEHIPGMGDVPGLVSILYGVVFSLAIAALYVPTQTRLGYARQRLVDAYAGGDLSLKTDIQTISKRRAFRDELDETSAMASTTTGALTVLGPLLSAAVSGVLA